MHQVTLALGTLRMASRDVIVKQLPVVEALGCCTGEERLKDHKAPKNFQYVSIFNSRIWFVFETAICSDKTGTLTKNEMTVRAVFTLAFPETKFGFTGVGYRASEGQLMYSTKHVTDAPQPVDTQGLESRALQALFNTACMCNNATRGQDDCMEDAPVAGRTFSGQPTELSLLVASEKAGFPDCRPQYTRVQETPFSSERKMMEVRARPVSGTHSCVAFSFASKGALVGTSPRLRRLSVDGSLFFVKGMPEKVLGECTTHVMPDGGTNTLDDDGKAQVLYQARRMGARGLRVLAMAYGSSLESLTFAGICGMEDPPREGVADCVRDLRRGGVKVMMVTGDAMETALEIGRRCGILGSEHDEGPEHDGLDMILSSKAADTPHHTAHLSKHDLEHGHTVALSGAELDAIPPHDLANCLSGVRVFYRVAPRHKLAIVQALQSAGEIVAMTGASS
jgi:P-type Ca2+ transporter type 2C